MQGMDDNMQKAAGAAVQEEPEGQGPYVAQCRIVRVIGGEIAALGC